MIHPRILVPPCPEHAPKAQAGCMRRLCTRTHFVPRSGHVTQLRAMKVLGKRCLTKNSLYGCFHVLHLQQAAVHVHRCKPAMRCTDGMHWDGDAMRGMLVDD